MPPDEPPIPKIDLPYLDRHTIDIEASPAVVWLALRAYALHELGMAESSRFASLLGTQPWSGFAITVEQPPHRLVARGRHRFSDYAIVFELHAQNPTKTRLEAHSYARFPGVAGALYRLVVIGTRLHVPATRHLLRAVRDRCF